LTMFNTSDDGLSISSFVNLNQVVHIGFVWSNDGSLTENGDTLRFYLDGRLLCSSRVTWEVGDTKSAVIKFGGGTTYLAHNWNSYGSAIFENIKIYNYCKTNFNLNENSVEKDVTYDPNDFIEISSDDVNFYGAGSADLPLQYTLVPPGESRTVYVRANKNLHFDQSKSTATLIVEWITSV